MPRKVFFSFHYEFDIFRVSQIRNSNVVISKFTQSSFLDHADWETVKRGGQSSIKNWIDNQIEGSTVTCVLIGSHTNNREWVHYEIKKSIERKNAILGVQIHNMRSINGATSYLGVNPFTRHSVNSYLLLSQVAPVYNWVNGNGYDNFGDWIEFTVTKFKNMNLFRGI